MEHLKLNRQSSFEAAGNSAKGSQVHNILFTLHVEFYVVDDVNNDIFDNNNGQNNNNNDINDVLRAVTYGSETCSPTKTEDKMLEVRERATKRRMLEVFPPDHFNNQTLHQSGVKGFGHKRKLNTLDGTRC